MDKKQFEEFCFEKNRGVKRAERDIVISLLLLGAIILALVGIILSPSENKIVNIIIYVLSAFFGLTQVKDIIALSIKIKALNAMEKKFRAAARNNNDMSKNHVSYGEEDDE